MTTPHQFDLICLGRAGVDLYGEQIGSRLEDMQTFQKYVGGCAANIAIGSARLGLKTAMLTRVGRDHFGRFITETFENENVNINAIKSDPNRLTALAILAIQNEETFPLLFYRENCADMALSLDDIDPEFIRSAKAFLVTGTHFSTPQTSQTSRKAIIAAKEGATKVVFDIDYRPVLWRATAQDDGETRFVANPEIAATLETVLPLCDLIVGTEEEFKLLGGSESVRQKTEALLIIKRGAEGCYVDSPSKAESGPYPGYPIKIYNVLGAGDAFISGFLTGWLQNESLATCCQWGNAAGALVVSRHGCAPAMPSFQELKTFIGNQLMFIPDRDPVFSQLHYASTRYHHYKTMCILAFDHRAQLEELLNKTNSNPEQLKILKHLISEAVHLYPNPNVTLGAIVDGCYGADILNDFSHNNYWVARPIEQPGSIPLAFEGGTDLTTTLRSWPKNQIVKCLITYHPDDRYALKMEQEAALCHLFSATKSTQHELLLEVLTPKNVNITPQSIAQIMERCYDLNVFPDWWKIAPPRDNRAWEHISKMIAKHDPMCRGVLLLGQNLREDQIQTGFQVAAAYDICKGFAIGRSIFMPAAEQWLMKKIDDNTLIEIVSSQFQRYIQMWESAKSDTSISV
jgi:5-dehydro-2-deoxygluconokinase